jgi:hypothetical protein
MLMGKYKWFLVNTPLQLNLSAGLPGDELSSWIAPFSSIPRLPQGIVIEERIVLRSGTWWVQEITANKVQSRRRQK